MNHNRENSCNIIYYFKELKFKKLPTFVMKIICMIDICKFLLIRDSSATIRTAERKNFLRPDIS